MIIGTIKHELSDKEARTVTLFKTRKIKIVYSKLLNQLHLLIKLTKYKSICIFLDPHFPFGIEQGRLSIGFDFYYRLKNVDHVGFEIVLNLIFLELQFEFSDWRHVEDYERDDNEKTN